MNELTMNSMRRWIARCPSSKSFAAATIIVASTTGFSGCDTASTGIAEKPKQPAVSAELDSKPVASYRLSLFEKDKARPPEM